MPELCSPFLLFVHFTVSHVILASSRKTDGAKNKTAVPMAVSTNGTNIMAGASRLSAFSPGGKPLKNAAYTIGSK